MGCGAREEEARGTACRGLLQRRFDGWLDRRLDGRVARQRVGCDGRDERCGARRQAWTEERTVAGRIRRWRGGEFVFSSPTGKPISPDTLARRFRSACRAAGVRAIRIHDLRHTYATLALRAGVPVQVVSERLGHSRVSITMDRYVGILQEQRLSGRLPLAELLGKEDQCSFS